jgi:hypothetical protein
MKNKYKKIASILSFAALFNLGVKAQVADFENIQLAGANSAKIPNVGVVSSSFTSGSGTFSNSYTISFGGYWSNGWAFSKVNDTTTAGFTNLYGSYANKGFDNSNNYAVSQNENFLKLNQNTLSGLYVSNSTYAALSIKNGDIFAKKFGGNSGNDSDWFKLTINAYKNGNKKTEKVEFYLADFRFTDNSQDYIIKDWTYVNLLSLGSLDSLKFTLTSSDTNQFGLKTPAFFCIDNIITNADTATFESLKLPFGQDYWNRGSKTFMEEYVSGQAYFSSSYSVSPSFNYWSSGFAISNFTDSITQGFTNLYSSANGKGVLNSNNYAVCNGNNTLVTQQGKGGAGIGITAKGIWINNGTYPYFSLKNGDGFAKKFGGKSGNDADFFRIIIYGYLQGKKKQDTTVFYLADYTNIDNSKDYIIKNWAYADLSKLGSVDSISFKLESTDIGQFGMNTPAFFCIDNFEYEIKTSVNEIDKINEVKIYPNPSSNSIFIDYKEQFTDINIINLQGKKVLQSSHKIIDISELEIGVYLIQIITENGVLNSKFVKQ